MSKSESTIKAIKSFAKDIKKLIDTVEPRLNYKRNNSQVDAMQLTNSFDDDEPPWPGEWDNRETR